jgi:hypothetical protein
MTFEEIIHGFATSEVVPVEAIQAALAEPTAFVDKAVPLLERMAARESGDDEDRSLNVLVHVLGEIGDERAFLPLMHVLRLPPHELDVMLGDTITETLGNVLIPLAGDRAPVLEEALADTGIDAFVRDAIFEVWTRLVLTGKVPKDSAETFLADYPVRTGLDPDDFGWSSWADSVTALGLAGITDFARRHLPSKGERSGFDLSPVTFEDFERQMSRTLLNPERWKEERKYQPFTDTIGELSRWYGYSEKYRAERKRIAALGHDDGEGPTFGDGSRSIFDQPYVASNLYRDVGRNDPCPCGSGRKFKKCCLEKVH